MKLISTLLCCSLLAGAAGRAQAQTPGVTIGALTAADASAALDIVSSAKGALLPRLTQAQRLAMGTGGVPAPATGLIVFQTDGTAGFYYNAGTPAVPGWQQLATAAGAAVAASNGLTKTDQNLALGGTLTGATTIAQAGFNLGFTGGNVGIGTTAPSARLDVNGSTRLRGLSTAGLVLTDANGNLSSSASDAANTLFWTRTGNSGTSPFTHFLGTTDAQDLVFKTNATERMRLKQNGALTLTSVGGSTFVGVNTGQNTAANTYNNTFVGAGAGQSSTTGNNNTYLGTVAGRYATTGSNNTALGSQAGGDMSKSGSGGNGNTLVGATAGTLIDAGADNTLVGRNSGRSIVGATGNAFFGAGTGELSTGIDNTFVGGSAGGTMLTGAQNVFLGSRAGRWELGSGNTMLGYNAGPFNGATAGTNNTLLGNNATVASGLSNATAIGNAAAVTASNALVLGGTGSNAVNVGVGTSAPHSTLDVRGSEALAYTDTGNNTSFTLGSSHRTVRRFGTCTTITLPAASTCAGRLYTIINSNGQGAFTLSVTGGGSVYDDISDTTFSGSNAFPAGTRLTVQSDGTGWIVVGR